MIDLITTMNLRLYQQYGSRMIRSIDKFADSSVRLIVVFEGELPSDIDKLSDRVTFLEYSFPDHDKFISVFSRHEEARGIRYLDIKKDNKVVAKQKYYDYRYDALRFSYKVFSLFFAKQTADAGLITLSPHFAWIDGDTIATRHFGEKELVPFLPEQSVLMTYLGRKKYDYSECGFLGFNNQHSDIDRFLRRMVTVYATGELFNFDQWHDSLIWDRIREEFSANGVTFQSVSGEAYCAEHPFINCGLGEFLDHLKGPTRKANGSSFETDRVKEVA